MKEKNDGGSAVNENIELLLGDYKKAIVRLSIPNMIAMFVQTLYNLVDAVWVAGLGPTDLAAMGFFFPINMIVIAIATGITVGTSSAIARKIGAKDYSGANSVAEHSIILALITSVAAAVLGILLLKPALIGVGASGESLAKAYNYGFIIYLFAPALMLNNTAMGILRGEGDSKRAMYVVTFSSILNVGLDPLFIYVFKLGIEGAAWATGVSIICATAIYAHILFRSNKTFLKVSFKTFKYNGKYLKDIAVVGFPTALGQITMSTAIYILNIFASRAGGDIGVATFTSAWRMINLGTLTITGISSAVTPVTGAAYGARDIRKVENALNYSLKFGEMVGLTVMTLMFLFSKQLAFLFAYTEASSVLLDNVSKALKTLCLFLPGTPLGMLTSGMFQGIGQGFKSLITTILRTIVFQVFWTWLLVNVFNVGLSGVWWGIVIGNATASMITYTWGRFTIKGLYRSLSSPASN
ncbi:MAG TPA: MATE family efflux transporter [Fervidobacterium sp.]|nr:MATE family efflux transporter [Fervidobacterium sp.]HRD20656.1 MATE family efflux transporter [Fervidobacterium sp.]